jgi:hypothetical protein
MKRKGSRDSHTAGGSTVRVIEVKARSANGEPRPVAAGEKIKADELLDFRIEVGGTSYVYVFTAEAEQSSYVWGHGIQETPWEAGVYAPEWSDGTAIQFSKPGDVALTVVTSPTWVPRAETWSTADLKDITVKCGKECRSTRFELHVQ